jgi:hypothetical protein
MIFGHKSFEGVGSDVVRAALLGAPLHKVAVGHAAKLPQCSVTRFFRVILVADSALIRTAQPVLTHQFVELLFSMPGSELIRKTRNGANS